MHMITTPRPSWLSHCARLAIAAIALFAPRLLPAQAPTPT
jgi:hypothetical protein